MRNTKSRGRKNWTISRTSITLIILLLCFVISGCASAESTDSASVESESAEDNNIPETDGFPDKIETESVTEPEGSEEEDHSAEEESKAPDSEDGYSFSVKDIPPYIGSVYVELNDNIPLFSEKDRIPESFIEFSDLDELGRCGVAVACLGPELLPTEPRGEIGMIRPSGWHTANYHELVEGNYLYNRSHLIAHSLCGENANEKNLITGTRYLNAEGMRPFEEKLLSYIEKTGNHVLYRVNPIFEGDNLVASGVTMEAESIEDDGIRFFIYVYNVQPGIWIDYRDGTSGIMEDNTESETEPAEKPASEPDPAVETESAVVPEPGEQASTEPVMTYILNTNSHKFHYPDCHGVSDMKDKNKEFFEGTRNEAIERGYSPCGICKP